MKKKYPLRRPGAGPRGGGPPPPPPRGAPPPPPDLTTTPINGTITDAAGNPPGDSSVAVTISLDYPDGAGGTTTASTNPTAGGSFTINSIPVGVRALTADYRATSDTVVTYAALLPKTGATVTMRLPGAPFAAVGGGGGGTGAIEFVTGSSSSPSDDIQFSIWNTGTSSITVSSLTANYPTTAYYRYIRWNGTVLFNSPNPRAASGQEVTFSASQTLNPAQSAIIRLEDFTGNVTGGGGTVTFANVIFTIQFSDGSSIAFNSL